MLAVPAWDFVRDARLHSRMAVLRAVENGFALARTAQQGSLTLSDAYGRIVAETSSSQRPDALLTGDLVPGPGATFYARTGDWFGWLALCLAAILLMWAGVMG
jgi:apolipoprotein N-acyltransferase